MTELAYSLHLNSDKNRKNISKQNSKNNISGTTSLPNNAIQNARQLSKVDKHNYRKYDNKQDLIEIVRGTSSPFEDVRNLYLKEFEEAKLEYNKLWDEYEKLKQEEDPEKELNKELLEGAIYRGFLSNQMTEKTIKLCDKLVSEGNKVVIGCCYDEELYTLRDYYGDKCVIYNGKMSLKQKDKAIKTFKDNDEVKVFIGNIKAAGVGITLIVSNKLIFNNMSYAASDNLQMMDRIHRIGQTKPCDIYVQYFKDTQYEHIWEISLRKEMIQNALIKKEMDK